MSPGERLSRSYETTTTKPRSVTIRMRRLQPALVAVDRTEHEAADLVVSAQNPIGYGEHLAACVASRGCQQHRSPIEDERRVAREREGWCVPGREDKRNEHGDVDGCGQGPGRFIAGLGSAGANPLPRKQKGWKRDNTYPNRQRIEADLDIAVHHFDATSRQPIQQHQEADQNPGRSADGANLAPARFLRFA